MIGDLRLILRKAKSWDWVVDDVNESVGNGEGKVASSAGVMTELAEGVVC